MKSNPQSLDIFNPPMPAPGLLYLLPIQWQTFGLLRCNQFANLNPEMHNLDQMEYPALHLNRYVDSFLMEFEDSIVSELEEKSNYLNLNKTILSPQIKKEYQWKAVEPHVWKVLNSKLKIKNPIICVINGETENKVWELPSMQIQIIFCSKSKSEAYVGFVQCECFVLDAVRTIGFEMGFIEMENSRIVFPDKYPQKPFSFHELDKVTVAKCQDTLLLVYNVECLQETTNPKSDFSFGEKKLNSSNYANAGDIAVLGIDSFEQVRDDGTMSTGAQTPSFFGSEDDNRERGQIRLRELFREKQPEEIQDLKNKAKKKANGSLIHLTNSSEEEMTKELENIAHDLKETITMHKKKISKQKDPHYE